MSFLSRCETVLMDGTFASCPLLLHQIFVVHGVKNRVYVPVAFCLLKDKKETSNEKARRHLKEHLPHDYEPKTTLTGFEKAIQGGVKKGWPTTDVHGGQAWYRKIQHVGLQQVYRSKSAP